MAADSEGGFRSRSKAELFMMGQAFLILATAYFVRDNELLVVVQAGVHLAMMLAYQFAVGGAPQDPVS